MNNLSFLLTLSYNVRLAFSLFLIFPQQHRILLLGHCCMYFILFYVFVYLICYRKKKKCLEKCVVMFGSNSMKVSVLFDMKSETCFLLLVVIVWKYESVFIFLAQCFFAVWFRFSCMYFLTIRMALIEKQSGLYLIFLKLFLATLSCLISGWIEQENSMVNFL